MRLRIMVPADIQAGLHLCRASGWNQLAADWERFLKMSPSGCRVALDDTSQVIGTVATLRYGEAFAWIAMVLVDPAARRAGIGTRLLEEALALLDDMRTVRLDATPAGFRVYEPAGFREEYRLQRMERVVPYEGGPPEGGPHLPIRRMTEADLDEVFAWDRQVFGADRRALLNSFRLQNPSYAMVAKGNDIEGYMFGRAGHSFEHIGPVIARDESVARDLVSACLTAHGDQPFILDVPVNTSWVTWLESAGFVLQRPFIRMYRGERRYRERTDRAFAIAGPEFG